MHDKYTDNGFTESIANKEHIEIMPALFPKNLESIPAETCNFHYFRCKDTNKLYAIEAHMEGFFPMLLYHHIPDA